MPQPQLATNVRKVTDDIAVLDIEGELTAFADKTLTDAYTLATDDGARVIILNFDNLQYMNSSGIGLLVTLLVRVNRTKQRLLTCGLSDHYKTIFELTRLNEAIGTYETEADAIQAAQS
ncbi:MAG TPA: STAS domain-containing protein [Chloroflexota bacterium]|nr:STAS domain-containing protein [Chloroflexota bacterium]